MENDTNDGKLTAGRAGAKPQSASIGFGEIKAVNLPTAAGAAAPSTPAMSVPKPEDTPRVESPVADTPASPKPFDTTQPLRPATVKLTAAPLAGAAIAPVTPVAPATPTIQPIGVTTPLAAQPPAGNLSGAAKSPSGQPHRRFPVRRAVTIGGLVMAALALLIGGGYVINAIFFGQKEGGNIGVSSKFSSVELPLEDVLTGGSTLIGTRNLVINGPLRANDTFTISPSAQPSNATPGTIYYDSGSNELAYYNGSEFIPISAVQNVGQGLSNTTGTLRNTGVLSLQGQTGNLSLTAGPGIDINSLTISNIGIISATAGSGNIVVDNDGNGNITISSVGAGSGTVTSGGGTAGTIALFTGAQNIEDSLITQSGGTITVSGDLDVTGDLTLGNPLGVINGGTGATSLAADGVLIGNGSGAITSVVAGAPGLCLVSTGGAPAFGACSGGASVTSLNGLTGDLFINNTTDNGVDTITIDDASTTQKGIAQFNSTNFTTVGGLVNTIQNISTTSSPTFNNLTLSGDIAVNGGDITSTAPLTIASSGAGNDVIINGADQFIVQDAAVFNGQTTFNSDVDMTFSGTENLGITSDLAGSVNVSSIIATPSGSAGTTRGMFIQQANSANTNGLDTGILIDNADADLAIGTGISFTNSGGGGFTTILDILGTALSASELTVLDGGIDESEVVGVITAVTAGSGLTGGGASGAVTVDVASGNGGIVVNANDITLTVAPSANGLSATTSSGSGLEVLASGLSLLQGCSDGNLLKWNETTDVWACSADSDTTSNSFTTIDAPSGTDPVADSSSDTLQVLATGTNLTITGADNPESLTFDISEAVLAGSGLAANGDALDVTTGNGLEINADAVRVNQNFAFTWTADHTFNLNGTENVDITSDLAGSVNMLGLVGTPSASAGTTRGIFVQQANSANTNGLDSGLTIDNADADLAITTGITFANSGGGGYTTILDILGTALSASELTVLDGGIDESEVTGEIESVTAGNGLQGGGASGSVTLDVASGNGGIVVNANDITLTLAPSADALSATTSSGSGLEILATGVSLLQGCSNNEILKWNEASDVWACAADGTGTASNSFGTIDTPAGTDPTADTSTDTVQLLVTGSNLTITGANDPETITFDISESTLAGAGIAANGDALDVAVANGVTLSGDSVVLDTNYNPTWTADHTWTLSGTENLDVTHDLGGTVNMIGLVGTPSASAGVTAGMFIQQANSANTNGLDSAITIDNADADLAIPVAINITNSGGGSYTNIMSILGTNLSAGELTVLDAGIDESEVTGVITAVTAGNGVTGGGASGAVTVDVASGNGGIVVNADDITLTVAASADALSATTSSGSGLEVLSSGLSLLQGCSNNEILKWNEASDVWACSSDNGAGASFTTIDTPAGSDPVADTSGDTLQFVATGTNLTITGADNPESVTFDISEAVLAGNGLAANGDALDVQTGNGLELNSDAVRVNQNFAFTWTADHTFNLNGTENVDITSDLAGSVNMLGLVGTPSASAGTTRGIFLQQAASANTNGLDNAIVIDNADNDLAITSGLVFSDSGGGGFTNIFDILGTTLSAGEVTVLDGGIDESEVTGDIESVTAGNGVTGGGAAGSVTVDVASGNGGIVVNADDITLTVAPSADNLSSTTSSGSGLEILGTGITLLQGCSNNEILKWNEASDVWGCAADVDTDTNSNGFASIDTPAGSDPVADTPTDSVQLLVTGSNLTITGADNPETITFDISESTLAGAGIAANGDALDVAVANGVTLSGDTVVLDTNYNPTWTADHTWTLSGTENLDVTHDLGGTVNMVGLVGTPSASAGNTSGLFIQQANSANTNGLDNALVIDNADADLAVGAAIQIKNTGGGNYTSIFDILGTTLSAGEVTVLDGGIDESEVTGEIEAVTAGSGLTGGGAAGSVTLDIASGNGGIVVNADNITLTVAPSANGLSATTSSGSGLEVLASGLSLLQGCSDTEILKWNEASDVWACATDGTGTASNSFTTIDTPAGTDPVADSPTDTLQLAVTGTNLTITGADNPESITFDIDESVLAGSGLGVSGDSLVVNTGNGLEINTDAVRVDQNYAFTWTNSHDFNLNGTENVDITSDLAGSVNMIGLVGTPSASAGTTRGIFLQQASSANTNGLDSGIVIDNADADLAITTGLVFSDSGGGGFTNIMSILGTNLSASELTVLDGGIDESEVTGDIEAVTAGNGVTGGGAAGSVTIDIASGNGGIVVNADDITLTVAPSGDALSATTSSGSGLEILGTGITLLQGCSNNEILKWNEASDIWACASDGTGTASNSFATIDTPAGSDPIADSATDTLQLLATGTNLTITGADNPESVTFDVIESVLAGNGLVANGDALDIQTGNGLELNTDAVRVNQNFSFSWTADHTWTLADTEDLAVLNTVTGTNAVDMINGTLTNQTSAGTQRGLVITNADDAANATTEALISLVNAEGTASTVTDGLVISGTAGAGLDTIVDGIDVSDDNITNAINVGANKILGSTSVIDFTNFDVDGSGNIVAGGTYNTNTFDGDTLTFGTAGTATISSAGGQALTITANASSVWSTSSGDLTLQSAGDLNLLPTGDVIIGTTDATGNLLVVDVKNTAGDPTGTDGAIYYNSNTGNFRCYQNGGWANCITASGGFVSLQNAYDNGNTIATDASGDIAFTLNGQDFTVTSAANTDSTSIFSLADGSNATPANQLVLVQNLDTDEPLANGIVVESAAGAITDGLDVSDSDLVNAINVGANTILGTTGSIDFTNFDLNASAADVLLTTADDLDLQPGGNIVIGAADTTGTLLVVDVKTDAGDPAGTDGAIYYNSNTNNFRCYQNGGWANCITASGGFVSLQNAYDNGNTIATDASGDIGFTLNGQDFTVMSAANTDSTSIFSLEDGSNATPANQLILVDNLDSDEPLANGIVVRSAAGAITDGLDVSDAELVNGVNLGSNFLVASGDSINDFTGTGLVMSGNSLTASLGTAIDTTEITDGTITGDDINSNLAGQGLTLNTGTTPDSLDVDILDSADGTSGITSSNSGLEFQGAGSDELTLLQGCGDGEVLKWNDSGTVWECSTDSAGTTSNSFQTIDTPAGTDPVADSGTDTLQLVATGTNLTITGANDPESVTFDIVESVLAGNGLVANADALDIQTGNGLELNTDAVRVNQNFSFSWTADHTWTLAGVEDLDVTSDLGGSVDMLALVGTPSASAGTTRGIFIQQADGAGGNGLDSGLVIDNADTDLALATAIEITNSGAFGTGITKGLDFNTTGIVTDIELQNGEQVDNNTDDLVTFTGTGGSNNETLVVDLDSAASSGATLSSGGTHILVNDNLSVGIDGNTTENISYAGFSFSGNDLYVDDQLGVNGNAFVDGTLSVLGTSTFDGNVVATALGSADNTTYLCRNSSNQIATCQTNATGSAFVQGGNTFGTGAILGTNDTQNLAFETDNTTRMTIGATGGVTVAASNAFTVTSGLTTLTGAATGDALNVSNSTSTGNIAVFKDNSTAVVTVADEGGMTLQNTTNSAAGAFVIKNAAGTNLLTVGTTHNTADLVTNGSAEQNITGWSADGSATVTGPDSTQHYVGQSSVKVVTTALAGDGVKYNVTLAATAHTAAIYIKLDSGSASFNSHISMGYSADGTVPGETDCKTGESAKTTGWLIVNCTFTPGATSGTPYFYLKQDDGVARTFYVDALEIVPGNDIGPYYEGKIDTGNLIFNNPVNIMNDNDSNSVFQVQDSLGQTLFGIDSVNKRVGINNIQPIATLHVSSLSTTSPVAILNQNGSSSSDILRLQKGGTNRIVVDQNGNMTFTNALAGSVNVIAINATPSASAGTTHGLIITQSNSANTNGVDSGITIDNADTDLAIPTAIEITNSGGFATGITKGLDFNTTGIVTDIELQNAEQIDNNTDDLVTFTGTGGSNNETLIVDLDSAASSGATLSSGGTHVLVNDNLSVGIDGNTTENISYAGFSFSGNDLYVDDMLGVNGNAFIDGTLSTLGAATFDGTAGFNGVATFNTDTDFTLAGTENVTFTNTTGSNAVDLLAVTLTNNDAGAAAQRGIVVTNANSTSTTESLIALDNADTTASSLTDGIIITSSGVADGITDAIDVSDANITNGINLGSNFLVVGGDSINEFEGNGLLETGGILAVQLLDAADGSGGTASRSGLEFGDAGNNELTLLQGCADGEILKWDDSVDVRWECAADNSGSATPDFDAVYAQSITNGNLTMEIDDAGGLIFDMTTTGDFIIKDSGTAIATFANTGGVTLAPTSGQDFIVTATGAAGEITMTTASTAANAFRVNASAGGIDIDAANSTLAITNTADGAGDDLTIAQAGAFDASLLLTSAGTGADAIGITATGASGDILVDAQAGTVTIDAGEAAANALLLTATGGTSATAHLTSNGTGTAAVDIDATGTGGDIDIDANDAITMDSVSFSIDSTNPSNLTITSDGAADDLTVAVAGATDSSLILSSSGTGADALQITTTAGGMDITVGGNAAGEDLDITATGVDTEIRVTTASTQADALRLNATAGGIDIDAANSTLAITNTADGAADDLTITQAGTFDASLLLTSAGTGADAIALNATGTSGDIVVDAQAGTVIVDGGEAAADAVLIRATGGTSATAHLTSNGTGTAAIDIDATGTGGDIDIDANDAITVDAATISFTLAAGTTDFTIAGLDADSNLILPGLAGANAVMYAAPTTGVVTTATTATGSLCLMSGAGASGEPSWASCPGGANWDTIGDPSGNGAIAFGSTVQTMDWANMDANASYFSFNFSNNGTSAGTDSGVVINNALVNATPTDLNTENLLLIQQLDSTATGTTVVDNALKIDSAASSGIADAIEINSSAGPITNGINMIAGSGSFGTGVNLSSGTFTTGIDLSGAATTTDIILDDGLTLAQTSDADLDIVEGGLTLNVDFAEITASTITASSTANIEWESTANSAASLKLESTQGGIDIFASGAGAGEDIDIIATGSSVNITSTEGAADGIVITSTNGGIDMTSTGAAAGEDFDFTSSASFNIIGQEAAVDAVTIASSADASGVRITAGDNPATVLANGNDIELRAEDQTIVALTAAGKFVVDASTNVDSTVNSTTSGTIAFSVDGLPASAGTNNGLYLDYQAIDDANANQTHRGFRLDFTNSSNDAADTTEAFSINNVDDAANTATDALLSLNNAESTADMVTNYLVIASSATDTATDAIDVSDSDLFNAINVGDNRIAGTTAVIDFSNFDLAGDGSFTWNINSATNGFLDLGSTGDFAIRDGSGGTTFATFDDSGGIAFTPNGASDFVITNDTDSNTQLTGTVTNASLNFLSMTPTFSSSVSATYVDVANRIDTTVSGGTNINGAAGITNIYSTITNNNTATIANTFGFDNEITNNNGGTMTNVYGNYFKITNTSGTITTAYGVYIDDIQASNDTGLHINKIPKGSDTTSYGININQASSANTFGYDAMIRLRNADSDLPIADGIILSTAGSSGFFTDALDASDANITNAVNAGDNTILGTTAVIDFTNFDVASTGALTVVGGLSPDITTQSNNSLTLQPGGTGAVVLTSTNTGTAAIDINATGSGGDIDIDANDAITVDGATMTFTLAAGTTDFTIAGLDADSNVILSGMGVDANAVLYTTTGGVLTRVTETETGSQCLLSGAGASGVPTWGACSGGTTPDFDQVYAQSITNGNLNMEVDDNGGLTFDLTVSGDFAIRDGTTAFATFANTGAITFAPTTGEDVIMNFAGNGRLDLNPVTYENNLGAIDLVRTGAMSGVAAETANEIRVVPSLTMTEPGSGTFTWNGANIDMSGISVTAGAGTSVINGLRLAGTSDADAGTVRGIMIENLTATAATEYALEIGSGWDRAISAGSTILVSVSGSVSGAGKAGIDITAGNAASSSGAIGGANTISGGVGGTSTVTGGAGGAFTASGGNGGANTSNGGIGGVGGAINLTGGTGGNTSSSSDGGTGGGVNISGGTGGTSTIGGSAGSGGTVTITGGTGIDGALGNGNGGDIVLRGGTATTGLQGSVIVRPSGTDNATAFQVQTSSSVAIFTVDTETSTNPLAVRVGDTSTAASPVMLVLDQEDADPTGVAGAMYFQTGSNTFRCYTTTWGSCGGGSSTLQGAYDGDADGSDTIIALTTADDGIIIRNPAASGSDSTYNLVLDQLATGAKGGLSIQSAGTGNLLLITDTTATAADVMTIADKGITTFKSQTNDAAAFVVKTSADAAIFTVDTSNSRVIIGTTSNGMIFTPASGPLYVGTGRPTKRVTLVPEYPGALITGDGSNNTGTMTSDFCENGFSASITDVNTGVCGSSTIHNYYTWVTTAQNDYDIFIRYQVPSDYVRESGNTHSFTNINMYGWRTDNTATTEVQLTIFNATGAVCGTADLNVATGTAAWTETAMTGMTDTDCDAIVANDVITFRIHLTANNKTVRAGEIRFDYRSGF